jgi:iron complex outermembrane receptor protein
MNCRLFFLATLFLVFVTHALYAQLSIRGVVQDSSGTPLAGANIRITSLDKGVYSNEKGQFAIKNLQPGSYLLNVSYLGYASAQKKVTLANDEFSSGIKIRLRPQPTTTDVAIIQGVRAAENAPVSQVTRSKEQIEAVYTGQDGAFLLETLSPSIVSYSESGTSLSNYGQLRLRGIDQTRINMTLNGVPLNDMIDQGVLFSNFTDFGNSIESVQIQRGVGTSSNGVSSYAGSVNFESIDVWTADPGADLQLTGGSFQTQRISGEVKTGKLENNTAFYTRFTKTNAEGYRYNSGTSSYSFFFSGGWQSEKHRFNLTGFTGRSKNQLAYSPVAISDIKDDPKTNYISPNDRDDFGQWMVQLNHQYSIRPTLSWANTVYYSGAGGRFPFGFEDEEGTFSQIDYPLFNDHFGWLSQISGRKSNFAFKWDAGLHLSSFRRTNEEAIIPDITNPYYKDQSQKDEISGFFKLEKKWGAFRLFADAQMRYAQLEMDPDESFLGMNASIPSRSWLFFNPKAGLSYQLSPQSQVYASFGRTGREPTRFDILGSTQINASNLQIAQNSESVAAEYVNDLEAGYRFRNAKLQIQLNAFYMQFENEIAPIGAFIPEGFVQIYENQEPSRRYGLEIDYRWALLRRLEWRGQASWMKAQISEYFDENLDMRFTDVTPILSPEWNISQTLEYELFDKITVGGRVRYLSEQFMELTNDPDLVVPSSFIADSYLHFQATDCIHLQIQFNNIFDELYYTYGAPVTGAGGNTEPGYFVQPPRHFYGTLTLTF